MIEDGKILIGKSSKPEPRHLALANRHGLITGATGTGKTVSLQVLAEGFSSAGVPVFAADIKGDLSGMAAPGNGKEPPVRRAKGVGAADAPGQRAARCAGASGSGEEPLVRRAKEIGVEYAPDKFPVVFWDLFGEQGHRVRATVSEMGPLCLAALPDLHRHRHGPLHTAL